MPELSAFAEPECHGRKHTASEQAKLSCRKYDDLQNDFQ